jgi:hypothetical protein
VEDTKYDVCTWHGKECVSFGTNMSTDKRSRRVAQCNNHQHGWVLLWRGFMQGGLDLQQVSAWNGRHQEAENAS